MEVETINDEIPDIAPIDIDPDEDYDKDIFYIKTDPADYEAIMNMVDTVPGIVLIQDINGFDLKSLHHLTRVPTFIHTCSYFLSAPLQIIDLCVIAGILPNDVEIFNSRKLLYNDSMVIDFSDNSICSICRGEYTQDDANLKNIHITSCSHMFHKECIDLWLNVTQNKKTCPICRQSISSSVANVDHKQLFKYSHELYKAMACSFKESRKFIDTLYYICDRLKVLEFTSFFDNFGFKPQLDHVNKELIDKYALVVDNAKSTNFSDQSIYASIASDLFDRMERDEMPLKFPFFTSHKINHNQETVFILTNNSTEVINYINKNSKLTNLNSFSEQDITSIIDISNISQYVYIYIIVDSTPFKNSKLNLNKIVSSFAKLIKKPKIIILSINEDNTVFDDYNEFSIDNFKNYNELILVKNSQSSNNYFIPNFIDFTNKICYSYSMNRALLIMKNKHKQEFDYIDTYKKSLYTVSAIFPQRTYQ